MKILTISLGRNILKPSRERERMQSYARHLEEFRIVVLTRRQHGYRDIQHEGTLHIYPTNSISRITMLWDAFVIARTIAKQFPKGALVISAQDPLEIGWLSWLLSCVTKSRLHIQVHGDYFSSGAWVGISPMRYIRRFFALWLLTHAPAIRVVSERIRTSLVSRGISGEKITVLPIRPEIESFLAQTHTLREAPPYTFLFMGRLAPEKDIQRIIASFKEVHMEYPGTYLRIVGEGSERASILKQIQAYDLTEAVTLLPWTENAPLEIAKADVFLLASKHEAYALTLIESLAVGVPVITTDVGCVGELVRDGVHGIVVREAGIIPYASAMKRMLVDAPFRKSTGEQGRILAQSLAEQSAGAYAIAWITATAV